MINEIREEYYAQQDRGLGRPTKIRIGLAQWAELKQECYERMPLMAWLPIDLTPGSVETFMGMAVETVEDMKGFELVSS